MQISQCDPSEEAKTSSILLADAKLLVLQYGLFIPINELNLYAIRHPLNSGV